MGLEVLHHPGNHNPYQHLDYLHPLDFLALNLEINIFYWFIN